MARRNVGGRLRGGRANRWVSLVVAAVLAGCIDQGPVPPNMEPPPDGLVVSEPLTVTGIPGAATGAAGQGAPAAPGEIFVSAEPGTFPDALSATVTNSATGAAVFVVIVDGGFDPVTLGGVPGDEIEILVRNADGTFTTYATTVPERKPPKVVRTRPPHDAVDVPLNVMLHVVFSEPVDPATVTLERVALRLNGVPVAATLTLVEAGLAADLAPQQPLEPDTTYTLEITTGIADLTGDELKDAVTVIFQTIPVLSGQIVFQSAPVSDVSQSDVYVMNADGSSPVDLTNHPAYDGAPAVSPDGSRILFDTDRDGNTEIYVMNVDGSGLANLTNHPAHDHDAVWSPDGTKIAFMSDRAGQNACYGGSIPVAGPCPDIFVMNADGSNPVNVTNHPADDDGYPAWSPDGTKIAFASNRAEPDSVPGSRNYDDIFVMNADGSNVVQLTTLDGPMRYAYWPAWSPDGTRIAFTGGPGTSGIWVMNADGSNPVRLVAGEQSVYGTAVWPAWSPDGSRIAFRACDLYIDCVVTDVFVMNADGSDAINLTNRLGFDDAIGSPQAWSP